MRPHCVRTRLLHAQVPAALLAALLVALAAPVAGAQVPGGAAMGDVASSDSAAAAEEPGAHATLDAQELEQLAEEASRAEATQIAGRDAALSERLRAIFAAFEPTRDVQVEVRAGIVVLTGTAATRDDAERAAAMARALEGVVLVVDELAVDRSMTRRLAASWAKAQAQLSNVLAYLPMLGVALAILALAWALARLLRDARFLWRFASERALLQNLLRQTVFAAVLLGGAVVALRFLDAGAVIGTLLGAAGVVGLALGFAFRNIVENYLAGILLAIRQPFRARDVVSIDGAAGTVVQMTTSETTLLDADGNHLRLPNAMVFNGKVVNYTRNPLRRFTVVVDVGNDVDLALAQRLGIETIDRMKGVVDDPAPSARVAALGDSTVRLELFGWVDQRESSYFKAASEALRLVKAAYDQTGLAMPPPAYIVQLDAPLPTASSGPSAPSARTAPEAPPEDAGAAPERIDVSAGEDVTKQVEAEIARATGGNLLTQDEA